MEYEIPDELTLNYDEQTQALSSFFLGGGRLLLEAGEEEDGDKKEIVPSSGAETDSKAGSRRLCRVRCQTRVNNAGVLQSQPHGRGFSRTCAL